MPQPRILISEPHAPDLTFLPYVWAILKSYWEHNAIDPKAFDWIDPIYLRETIEEERLTKHCDGPVDVVGLSCYTWNWDLNCKVAQWAKKTNPNCLVVAGGPDPDYKDPDFFLKHSYIDVIIVKDGEIPFTKILETVLEGKRDFEHIPGLYLPSFEPGGAHRNTGAAEVPKIFDYSPYKEQTELYERIMRVHKDDMTFATLETNRGCPYSCNYCDWGSATMSKVRKFEMSRVHDEIECLAKLGVTSLVIADANFGLLPRDVEIADRLGEVKAKYNFPKGIYYSSAKNNPERTIDIAKRTYDSGLTRDHVLAVQHTDADVLKSADRANIPASKYREVVSKLAALGIPSEVQLILGIPGDTVQKWKDCLAEIMQWGVHDNYQVSPYALLPNAPAADPAFREEWQIETVVRGLVPFRGFKPKETAEEYSKSNMVVGWRGFTHDDWVEVSTYSTFVKAWHNRSLTRLPALYLWFVHGVSYREFYDAVIDDFARQAESVAPLSNRVRGVYAELLRDPEATDAMEIEELPQSPFIIDPSRWVYAKTCLKLDQFYADLLRFLVRRFPQARHLKSCINYQRDMVITPDFSNVNGKRFAVDRDWPTFFAKAHALSEYQKLEDPAAFFLPKVAEIQPKIRFGFDSTLDFGDDEMSKRWIRWLWLLRMRHTLEFSNYPRPVIRNRVLLPFRARPRLGHFAKKAPIGLP